MIGPKGKALTKPLPLQKAERYRAGLDRMLGYEFEPTPTAPKDLERVAPSPKIG